MEEKTEDATPKKKRDARDKGQVANSQEVVSTFMMAANYGLIFAAGTYFIESMQTLMTLPGELYDYSFSDAMGVIIDASLSVGLFIMLPFILTTMVAAIFSNYVQIGSIFSFEPLKPELKKLNPIEGAKRIFSSKSLVELVKSSFKVSFLTLLIYLLIIDNMNALVLIPYCGTGCLLPVVFNLLTQLAVISIAAFIMVAIADIFFQRYQHSKQLRMTKDEVKREYKDTEGNPEIKGERRRLYQEMLNGGMLESIKSSSLIVTNPTHFAVGISYDDSFKSMPRVTIKGADYRAQLIKDIARAENIPMIEHVPLAQGLYKTTNVHQTIPDELMDATVEVLRWLEQIRKQETGLE